MIIKITCTTNEYQAGLVYNVPDKKAQELIDADMAFEVGHSVPLVEVTSLSDKDPVYVEGVKQKKVKHGNG